MSETKRTPSQKSLVMTKAMIPHTSPKQHNEDFTNVVVKQEKLKEAEKSKPPEQDNWPIEANDTVMMTPEGIAEQHDVDGPLASLPPWR